MLTIDDAVLVYARASRAWFQHNAKTQAAMKARTCLESGDAEGVEVWRRVEDEIDRLDRAGEPFRSLPFRGNGS